MLTDPENLRQAMRFWATGVTVVTSAHDDTRHGMTVSSFTSLSLSPPQILVALTQDSRTHGLIVRSRVFGISILADGQEEISDRFAGRIPDDGDRLAGLDTFTLETGSPLLRGGLAYLDCRLVTTLGSGTHSVFVGEVLAARAGPDSSLNPLLYFDRGYRNLQK